MVFVDSLSRGCGCGTTQAAKTKRAGAPPVFAASTASTTHRRVRRYRSAPDCAPPGAINASRRRTSGMPGRLSGQTTGCGIIRAMFGDAGEAVPRLRGLLHAYAAVVAVAAAGVLVVLAPEARSRVSALVYGVGLCALFAVSGLYHRWRWNPRWRPILRRLDHSMIFVFIAASATPVAVLVLSGTLQTVVLIAVWAGAAGGIALSVAWITAPRVLVAVCYLAVGWAGV